MHPATPLDRELLRRSWESWISYDGEREGPRWLQLVWTLLFAAALAVGFTVLGFFAFGSGEGAWRNLAGWWYWYQRNFVVCLTISLLIHGLFELLLPAIGGAPRVRRMRPWQRTVFFSGVPMLGVVLGWPLGVWLAGADVRSWVNGPRGTNVLVGSLLLSLLLTFVLHQWFWIRTRQMNAEKRATEAQLRLLQGQIEPHFLFNTLAGVSALIEPEPARAKAMLQAFTEHLRGVLGALRDGDVPLQTELDLAAHYLRLMGFRMEDRLRWELQAEPGLGDLPVPPLLLQPLIENAIVHGLEPALDGGTIRIGARRDGAMVELTVHDDGVGLEAASAAVPGRPRGNGVALANVRQRLQARYGSAASLVIEAAQPGTRAVLRLPLG